MPSHRAAQNPHQLETEKQKPLGIYLNYRQTKAAFPFYFCTVNLWSAGNYTLWSFLDFGAKR